MEHLKTSEWKNAATEQSRVIFGEVIKKMNIHKFFVVRISLKLGMKSGADLDAQSLLLSGTSARFLRI